jgi:hypothetical protein
MCVQISNDPSNDQQWLQSNLLLIDSRVYQKEQLFYFIQIQRNMHLNEPIFWIHPFLIFILKEILYALLIY